jgi:hypothetical protein
VSTATTVKPMFLRRIRAAKRMSSSSVAMGSLSR